jgi:hypothetical protein
MSSYLHQVNRISILKEVFKTSLKDVRTVVMPGKMPANRRENYSRLLAQNAAKKLKFRSNLQMTDRFIAANATRQ